MDKPWYMVDFECARCGGRDARRRRDYHRRITRYGTVLCHWCEAQIIDRALRRAERLAGLFER